jgi:hypothetical protein
MKRYSAQLWFLTIFLIFITFQIALLVVCHFSNGFGAAQLKDLIVQLVNIYSIPLSVIVAGLFATRGSAGKLDTIFYASVVLAILWNGLFAWRTIELTLAAIGGGEDKAKYFSEYLKSLSQVSTFLISGLLTYYFAKAPEGSGD